MGRRRHRYRNRKDEFGIYELPEYRQRRKKKKKMTVWSLLKALCGVVFLCTALYITSIGVKYSMYHKGLSLYGQKDYSGAVSLFEESLKPKLPLLENFDCNVRAYLADCYVNTGEYGAACTEYNQIALWQGGLDSQLEYKRNLAYGLQLYEWQDYRNALPVLLAAYEDGYGELVLYVGSCYGQLGDLNNMQIYYNVFLQSHEMNSFMYAQYAAIALDEGNMEEAMGYIETGKAQEDQSHVKELLFDEIVYYEKLKDYNTAYEKAKEFVENYPNDEDGRAEYDLLYTRQTLSR